MSQEEKFFAKGDAMGAAPKSQEQAPLANQILIELTSAKPEEYSRILEKHLSCDAEQAFELGGQVMQAGASERLAIIQAALREPGASQDKLAA